MTSPTWADEGTSRTSGEVTGLLDGEHPTLTTCDPFVIFVTGTLVVAETNNVMRDVVRSELPPAGRRSGRSRLDGERRAGRWEIDEWLAQPAVRRGRSGARRDAGRRGGCRTASPPWASPRSGLAVAASVSLTTAAETAAGRRPRSRWRYPPRSRPRVRPRRPARQSKVARAFSRPTAKETSQRNEALRKARSPSGPHSAPKNWPSRPRPPRRRSRAAEEARQQTWSRPTRPAG